MTRTLPAAVAAVAVLLFACSAASDEPWAPVVGDVVFHSSTSSQSAAIELATKSKWSHVGLVVRADGEWAVIEAVQPVRIVPLKEFLARGVDGRYAAYRPTEPLTDGQAERLTAAAKEFVGRDYDAYFGWDDDLIYCSELIWKAYDRGLGIELSEPRALASFDLTHPTVAALMQRRWPAGVPDDVAVSPQDLADSELLKKVAMR